MRNVLRGATRSLPRADCRIERSENARGPVWIDVSEGDQGVVIEWRQGMSLGLTSLPAEGSVSP